MKYILTILLFMTQNCKSQTRETEIVKCHLLVSKADGQAYVIKGFAVKEKHSTAENDPDPGFSRCIDNNGNIVPCHSDYWVTIKYLTADKKELPKDLIVWQAK